MQGGFNDCWWRIPRSFLKPLQRNLDAGADVLRVWRMQKENRRARREGSEEDERREVSRREGNMTKCFEMKNPPAEGKGRERKGREEGGAGRKGGTLIPPEQSSQTPAPGQSSGGGNPRGWVRAGGDRRRAGKRIRREGKGRGRQEGETLVPPEKNTEPNPGARRRGGRVAADTLGRTRGNRRARRERRDMEEKRREATKPHMCDTRSF
jgi:hypothetical protein